MKDETQASDARDYGRERQFRALIRQAVADVIKIQCRRIDRMHEIVSLLDRNSRINYRASNEPA